MSITFIIIVLIHNRVFFKNVLFVLQKKLKLLKRRKKSYSFRNELRK